MTPAAAKRAKRYRERNRERINARERAKRLIRPDVYNASSNLRYMKDFRKRLFESARSRAKTDDIKFDLSLGDIVIPAICPILGIDIVIPVYGETGGKKSPNAPSLDRIDSSKGYIRGNIQVISWRANDLKKNATMEELALLGQWALQHLQQ